MCSVDQRKPPEQHEQIGARQLVKSIYRDYHEVRHHLHEISFPTEHTDWSI